MSNWINELTQSVEERKALMSEVNSQIDDFFKSLTSVLEQAIRRVNVNIYEEEALELHINFHHLEVRRKDSEYFSIAQYDDEALILKLLLANNRKSEYAASLDGDRITFGISMADIARLLIEPIVRLEFHLD